MREWLDRLFTEPMRDNPYALGLMIVILLGWAGPLMFMMGRDMWRRKRETKMTDEPQPVEKLGHEQELSDDLPVALPITAGPNRVLDIEPDAEHRRWEAEAMIDRTEVLSFGGARADVAVPAPLVSNSRIDCEHCGGRGFVPGINDLLKDSVALIAPTGDEVVRMFYLALFSTAPDLVSLFPGNPTQGDLGTDHRGAKQREKLLAALVALANLYDPADAEKMTHLDQALGQFGRSHAAFVRKDGTIRGATLDEYAAVKDALFTTLVRFAGEHWRPEYTEAWSQAYDYAAAVMLTEQFRSGFTAPRFARA